MAKSYQVGDAGINRNTFSNQTDEEKILKAEIDKYSDKSSMMCIVLCLFMVHYFYVGRIGRGIITILTANFLFIGLIIDLIMIGSGKFKDKDGKYVNTPGKMAAVNKLQMYYQNVQLNQQAAQERQDLVDSYNRSQARK